VPWVGAEVLLAVVVEREIANERHAWWMGFTDGQKGVRDRCLQVVPAVKVHQERMRGVLNSREAAVEEDAAVLKERERESGRASEAPSA